MARPKKPVDLEPFKARNSKQQGLYEAIRDRTLTLASGAAGTGKTHITARVAAEMILSGQLERHIILRPLVAVEDEDLGSLPGDLEEKIAPWARPVMDELKHIVPKQQLPEWPVETVPIGLIRGLTFENAFVHVTEAQNLTPAQLHAIATRLGENSRLVIDGDPSQCDGPSGILALVTNVAKRLGEPFGHVVFKAEDCVRSEFTRRWLQAWDAVQANGS